MRARGLKLYSGFPPHVVIPSRPMRARGLKLFDHGPCALGNSRAPCGRVD